VVQVTIWLTLILNKKAYFEFYANLFRCTIIIIDSNILYTLYYL